jgi:group I intron endonuclease
MEYLIPDEFTSGTYRIEVPDGSFYVGSTKNFWKRYKQHLTRLLKGCHSNPYMQNKFNKYPLGWKYKFIEQCNEEYLLEIEQKLLNEFCGKEMCLNLNPLASKPPSPLGKKLSPEQCRKISERCKANTWCLGKKFGPCSEETKKKISKANKGRTSYRRGLKVGDLLSDEGRKRISEANKGRPSWNKGLKYPCTPERRAKLIQIWAAKRLEKTITK